MNQGLDKLSAVLPANQRTVTLTEIDFPFAQPRMHDEWEVSTILKKAAAISDKKRQDYAGTDPDENFIRAAEIAANICKGLADTDPRRATAILIGVKLARLQNLGLNGAANHESVDDTLDDTINYVAILKRQTLRARAGVLTGAK